jgi:outer membrane receptor protein involved in Fe transport
MTGGNVSLDYTLQTGTHVYASLARGYKAGGFNIGAASPQARRGFDPEFLWSLEAGVKHSAVDQRLQLQMALFAMRRTQMQVSTSVQLQPGDPLSFIYLTDNAARGENSGFEGSAHWAVSDRLTFTGTAALLRTKFIGYQYGDRNLDGRDQAHAPRYQYSLSTEYRHPRGLRASVEVQGAAGFYFSESHDQRANARTLVNARLGFESPRWSAMLYGRNLFNDNAVQRGFFFGNEPPDFPDKLYVQHGDPRQVGIMLTLELQ